MKKVLLAVMMLALATPAFAADAYVGLFADANHSSCSVNIVGGFYPFEVWIWMTSHLGVQAAEYKMTAPAGAVIVSTVTTNPDITASLGDVAGGISVAFGACQNGWVWTQHVSCYLLSPAPMFVLIEARPGVGLQIASCELGFPIYPATVLNHLALNQPCVVATENASWGAIKSLF